MGIKKKKTSKFIENEIDNLAANKPVVYEILNKNGKNIYTGSAKKGRIKERIKDHLSRGPHPIPGGEKVRIIQKDSIDEAKIAEKRIIKKDKPKFNK